MHLEEETFLYRTVCRTESRLIIYKTDRTRHFHAESAEQQQIGAVIFIKALFSCQMRLHASISHIVSKRDYRDQVTT